MFSHHIPSNTIHNAIQNFNKCFVPPANTSPPEFANAVLDVESGKMLEYHQLIHHDNTKIHETWTTSAADEFGRLFQGVGTNNTNGKRVEGTNTFFFIHHHQVPKHKIKEVTYARIVCTIRDMKANPFRTRMTVGGNKINYQGDVGTPTAHLETAKLLFNSVLSRPGAKFMIIDLVNFYLMTPMKNFEYMRIKLSDIPTEIINEYNLH